MLVRLLSGLTDEVCGELAEPLTLRPAVAE